MSEPWRRIFQEITAHNPRFPLTRASVENVPGLQALDRLGDEDLLGGRVVAPLSAACVRAGLLLRAEQWERAHAICQEIETPDGSFWHGILHRREPDAGNAHYWFHRTGRHPALELLGSPPGDDPAARTQVLTEVVRGGRWDPGRLTDLSAEILRREASGTGLAADRARRVELEALQAWEVCCLLEWSANQALGRSPGNPPPPPGERGARLPRQ